MMLTYLLMSIAVLSLGVPGSPNASGLRVSVQSLDSDAFQATLIGLTPDAVKLRRNGEPHIVPMDDVLRIRPVIRDVPPAYKGDAERVTCHLIDGGLLVGSVAESDAAGVLRLNTGAGHAIDLPFTAIAAVRFGSESNSVMLADFDARREERKPGRDVLLLSHSGRATAVPGALERLSPAGWSFRFGRKTREGRYSHAYGVILGSAGPRGDKGPVAVSFGGGNQLFGRIVEGDDRAIMLNAGPLGRVPIPWATVRSVDLDSGRVVRLNEQDPVSATCDSLIGGDWPAQRNANVTGGPLRIGGRSYENGWGVHATSRLVFDLKGDYERFVCDAGVDASVGMRGSVVFRVIADDDVLFESDVMQGGQAAQKIKVDLGSAKQLILECDRADGLDISDHADWANAYLVRRKDASAS